MKVIVHIRQAVEVEVPNALVPTRSERYGNTAMQKFAIDSAMSIIHQQGWQERESYGGHKYMAHPSLGWIEYPKKEMKSGAI